jgi:hypothetical protein
MTLVLGRELLGKTRRKVVDHPSLPVDPGRWHTDLYALAAGGVPATFRPPGRGGRGDWSLVLHVQSYVMRLYPRTYTDRRTGRTRQDSYTLGDVSPQRLRDHDELAKGCLLLRPTGWALVHDPQQIPPGSNSFWSTLVAARQQLDQEVAAAHQVDPLSAEHIAFLDRVDRLIDAAQDITTTEEKRATYPYSAVDPTGERRQGTQAIYDFRLVGGRAPDAGTFVQVRGEPEQRGRVTRVTGTTVTIAFDTRIDFARLAQQGELEVTPSSVVFEKEREAVNLLRTGQSRNPGLLSVLVDGRVRPLVPASVEPKIDLDDDQRMAMRKAVAVEDVLLIQGPPGTGKTRTISQIAGACAEAGQRVLVTAHTNRAVDNVLERLPADLLAIRVGNDGKVTTAGRPYLLEEQVAELRDRVANVVGRSLVTYEHLGHAQQWAGELGARIDDLGSVLGEETRARAALTASRRAVGGPAQARVDAVAARREQLDATLARSRDHVTLLIHRRGRIGPRAGWPVVGWIFAIGARRLDRRLAAQHETAARTRREFDDLGRELAVAVEELDAATRQDPGVQAAGKALQEVVARRDGQRVAATRAAHSVRHALAGLVPAPSIADDAEVSEAWRALNDLQEWSAAWLPLLAARRDLLAEWSDQVARATDDLHPELIRYADVIAATAIGSASRPELSEVDFDLSIVDEAGQIGVADALVPLVRARRGVLVGDHMQLPPFLDSEVQAWGAGQPDPVVLELLAKSAFELLATDRPLPESHVVRLRVQRRMPPSIARFISTTFYDGWLTSNAPEAEPDDLFERALTFVDTSDLPPSRRFETPGRQREHWGQAGYTNPTEAALLVQLAAFYHRRGGGDAWAVIVPYRAQVAAVTDELGRLIGDPVTAELNVGTVDAFQGGEREVILYGFTRSNPDGKVGFLKELRRGNVAFTRAKRRLVLVGDLTMLTKAQEPGFRTLARSLRQHVGDHGELRRYDDVEQHLARLETLGVGS